MHSRRNESVAEHSHSVALLAHTLAIIDNEIYKLITDCNFAAVLALYHDATEVFTGDMPTPVKYRSPAMMAAYDEAESNATDKLIGYLPLELKITLESVLDPDKTCREYILVKYADKLCAYIKCIEEVNSGNSEFINAKKTTLATLKKYNDKTLNYFIEHFIKAFELNLDELMGEP